MKNQKTISKKIEEKMEYCECSIYISNGEGQCYFCNKGLRPIRRAEK